MITAQIWQQIRHIYEDDTPLRRLLNEQLDTIIAVFEAQAAMVICQHDWQWSILASRHGLHDDIGFILDDELKTTIEDTLQARCPTYYPNPYSEQCVDILHPLQIDNVQIGVVYIAQAAINNPDWTLQKLIKQVELTLESMLLRVLEVTHDSSLQYLLPARPFQSDISEEVAYSRIIEELPALTWLVDENMHVHQLSGEWLLRTETPIQGESLTAIVADTDLTPLIPAHRQALKGQTSKFDLTIGDRAYQITVVPFSDDTAVPTASLGLAIDITPRKTVETHEREQYQLLKALNKYAKKTETMLEPKAILEVLLNSIYAISPYESAHILVLQNDKKTYDLVAYRGRIETDMALQEMSYQLEKHSILSQIADTQQAFLVNDVRQCSEWVSGGHTAWAQSYLGIPIILSNKVIGFVNLYSSQKNAFACTPLKKLMKFTKEAAVTLKNAYEFVNLQTDLQLERERLKTILHSIEEGILYIEDGDITFANATVERITGYLRCDVLGQNINLLMKWIRDETSRLQWHTAYQQFLRTGIATSYETTIFCADDTQLDVCFSFSMMEETHNGKRVVCVIRNISERKLLDERRTKFISHASHELRTPIANLRTRLDLIRMRPSNAQKHVEIMDVVVRYMQDLTSDLLDLARLEKSMTNLSSRLCNLTELATSVIQLQMPEADKKQQKLYTSFSQNPIYAYVDPTRINQAITNLLINAINYTPAKGHIHVLLEQNDQVITMHVHNTGSYIKAKELEDIFHPFYRATTGNNVRGTGLGLAITKEIVDLHHGDITVNSGPYIGTTFSIKLPAPAVASIEKIS